MNSKKTILHNKFQQQQETRAMIQDRVFHSSSTTTTTNNIMRCWKHGWNLVVMIGIFFMMLFLSVQAEFLPSMVSVDAKDWILSVRLMDSIQRMNSLVLVVTIVTVAMYQCLFKYKMDLCPQRKVCVVTGAAGKFFQLWHENG